ncbi:uncharacterized protein LOC111874775 isoform X2 [Cryptotermes secundus]|uniref:uncharacterized protein LOC111874775 isoform X2 n=1 Tax=Cryptotermes secundus TaxID=105785 RepID=UPI000CD7B58F|nr:uncharacterized protein LOC111874775 isoform X2 [Cryptotermes secundus]
MLSVRDSVLLLQVCLESCLEYRVIQHVSADLALKILLFVLMVACNAGVWMCFVKALQQSPSSLPPTVISTAINYVSSHFLIWRLFSKHKKNGYCVCFNAHLFILTVLTKYRLLTQYTCSGSYNILTCTALLGSFVFGEETSLLWWSGATLVLLGLMLICHPHKQHEQ